METHGITVDELPKHFHTLQSYRGTDDNNFSGHLLNGIATNDSETLNIRKTNDTGNDSAHNNLSPTIAVYAWRRQA